MIYDTHSKGGNFVNYDKFCTESELADKKIESYWIEQIKSSGISQKEYDRWLERKKLDRECSMAQESA